MTLKDLQPRCDAIELKRPCDGGQEFEYITTDGSIRRLCAHHAAKLAYLEMRDGTMKQLQRLIEKENEA